MIAEPISNPAQSIRASPATIAPQIRRGAVKSSESIFLDIRGLRYHCRVWGEAGRPKLFMLHGWMDVSASFQFLVDALRGTGR